MFTMTAREFNQSVAHAQRVADGEPVLITKRGEPAYVLLNIAEYERLAPDRGAAPRSLLDVIEPLPEGADPDDLFGEIMAEIAAERSREFGREIDL
ncbi:MAG: type II toxin-antitoxin system prevent-host-death family antitoxin [Microbacterium sp.]|nr:type II toxin-antitoxin system prevent-host-death family antitoxin [Microbacterium sp.]